MYGILLPRGIRNHNPGNLRLGQQRWQGQKTTQTDSHFVEFETPLYGLRALMRTLITYRIKYGLDTVESLMNRFAPPFENATDHYIYNVARALRVKRQQPLNILSSLVLIPLAAAIVRQENGHPLFKEYPESWYAPDLYAQAARLAGASSSLIERTQA